MHKKPVIVSILMISVTLLSLIAILFSQRNAPPGPASPVIIEVILPNEFEGLAVIKFGVPDGEVVEQHDGRWTYHVPSSGVLKVRGENPQYQSHVVVSRRVSGGELPIAYLSRGDELPQNVIAVWPLLLDGDDAGFFVGNTSARKLFRNASRP
jgi:hypothetical protein